ncbi:hypothetical protein VKT23_000210 [Stygiomarasmius scandens]|uniref:Uncharacterized protein n=1 Tax=Marasmiellus scandens TaxID=2682957 RepID=A0ABR1K3F5_9AGAR
MYAAKVLSFMSLLAVFGSTVYAQDSTNSSSIAVETGAPSNNGTEICKSSDDCPGDQICCVNLAPEGSDGCREPLNPKFGIGPVCLHG